MVDPERQGFVVASTRVWDLNPAAAFVVFGDQDSGCASYGVESAGRRWFVKRAGTPAARGSLTRALGLHAAVRHPAMVRPELVRDGTDGPTLVYPWCDGTVLSHATTGGGSDRSGLAGFQRLPVAEVRAALDTILAYRPGPLVLDSDRLTGSRRYLSPEELTRGAAIDDRTSGPPLPAVRLDFGALGSFGRYCASCQPVEQRVT